MVNFQDLTGQRFGRLLVIERAGKDKHGSTLWVCRCDCGGSATPSTASLNSEHTQSCGCLKNERISQARRLPAGVAARNRLFDRYYHSAVRRGYSFELTREEAQLLFEGDCAYCGVKPSQVFKKRATDTTYTYNGIDRVNNTLGYTVENCVSCCGLCNQAKSTLSRDEFLDLVRDIARNLEL